ncbi:succinate dehydrogenase/fumarate reductase flavoprotein subunit [Bradyrhizobium sp. LM3.4]
MALDQIVDGLSEVSCDVLVIGGGTAGPMAALKAKLKNPKANVVLLEKANVKRSGAISMGMDGLNNAVIPGYATPEQYTKEITIANDGIVDQKAVYKYAQNCYKIVEELDSFGIRFLKNENGDYAVKKVHHIGSYVLPMPNGETVKKALYRQLRRARILISNRYMATRLLKSADGRIAGAISVNTRTAEILVIKAKSVILCMGAAGRLGLPTSGYMFGTYENAANSGDGYAMAYHAGAALANLECYQINPLIKDYNGPACAYVAGPFGAFTANNEGSRFIECDYWSGQMMLEFYNELLSGKGPVFLQLKHLHPNTIEEIETTLHKVERPDARPVPTGARHRLPQRVDRDAHLRDRFLLGSQRLRRVRRRQRAHHCARPLCRGRYGERAAQLHAGRLHQRGGRRHRRDGVCREPRLCGVRCSRCR